MELTCSGGIFGVGLVNTSGGQQYEIRHYLPDQTNAQTVVVNYTTYFYGGSSSSQTVTWNHLPSYGNGTADILGTTYYKGSSGNQWLVYTDVPNTSILPTPTDAINTWPNSIVAVTGVVTPTLRPITGAGVPQMGSSINSSYPG